MTTDNKENATKKATKKVGRPVAKKERDERIPFSEQIVEAPFEMDPEYYYYRFNDTGSRIERALKGGYEFIDAEGNKLDDRSIDSKVQDAQHMGSNISVPVGNNVNGIYMRLPKKYHEQDLQLKKQKNRQIMQAIENRNEYNKRLDGADISAYNKASDRIKIEESNRM